MVVPELDVETEQPSVVVEADLDVVLLRPLVGRGDEVLAAVLGELHRPSQRHRRERHEELLGPRVVDLDAEAAADVGCDHVDVGQVEPELGRDAPAHAGGGLRRRPDGEPAGVGVPAGDRAAPFHGGAGGALDVEVEGQRVGSGGDGRPGVAVLLLHPGADVAGDVLVDESPGRPSGRDADHRLEEVVGHPDPPDRVLGDVAVDRDDEGDRLPDVVDLLLGQRVLRPAVGQRRVRDQQRQRVGHRADEVLVGPHHHHAVDVEHVGDVDVGDARVGVRRSQHRGVQQPRVVVQQVVDVAALPAQESLVLHPRHLGTEELGGHGRSRSISAARSTDFTMFW